MKAGDIQNSLAANNRWWRTPDWQERDPDLRRARQAPFSYRSGCLSDLTTGGLYVLRGPRRAGKSTEIKYQIADLIKAGVPSRNIVHATVDGWRSVDIQTLVTSARTTFLAGVSGPRYWFIDEISSVAGDWPNVIKSLRDNDPDFAEDTVVLTGSSASRLHEVRKALAGRRGPVSRSDRTMLPMRFTDFVAAADLQLPQIEPVAPFSLTVADLPALAGELLPYLNDLVAFWEAYLRIGGFPQAVAGWLTTGDITPDFVQALWDVVHGDAIAGARFTAPQTAVMLSSLAKNICSPLNVSDLAREADVANGTIKARLADLAESFLMWPCHREQGLAPRLNAQSKWYFTDPLVARLASIRGRGHEPDLTQLSEQQVGVALLRAIDASVADSIDGSGSLLYYRHSTGAEIDFVSRDLGGLGVESKFSDDGRLGRTRQTFTAAGWHGIIATRSLTQWDDKTSALPAPILALLLGS